MTVEGSDDGFIPDGGTQLCEVASSLRGGISCCLGPHLVGGFNVIFEVIFEDQAIGSDHRNSTGVSYILMEKLDGQPLPVLEDMDLELNARDLALARKLHQQLADVILELATLKFDKIGSLREDSKGGFFIAAFANTSTLYSERRASAYDKLFKDKQGPFSSVSDFYEAMSDLNDLYACEDPESEDEEEEETDKEIEVSQFKQLRGMAPTFIVHDFDNGPFVIHHDDLTLQNILVDDEFNVTGIIDFPGTVVPLPSLCVFPWLFRDDISGLMTDRDMYLDVFLNRDAPASSALASKSMRGELMRSAIERQDFELGLMGPYASLNVPRLLRFVYGKGMIFKGLV
ncbi:hypothetical protein MMC22_002916 [Lobaria immixta]|nr:hypothetical protein [Lobaria immixta]